MTSFYPWLWIVLIVVFGIAEAMTIQLVSIWFCVGGIAAFVTSLVTPTNIGLQFVVFVGVSAISLALSRVLFKDKMKPRNVATNADMVIGKEAIVLREITPEAGGRVKVDGQDWAARSASALPVGARCKVTGISGVTLTVDPIVFE
ncbi:MAG: NfeD family protein [Pygmaiobacter sp.]|jgi:membrane protein implicated in regulation of membrane protease activity|nr:NfeD family protein [Pygmaiobacter sp.]